MLKSNAQQNQEVLTSARTKLGESYDILRKFDNFKEDLPSLDHVILKITMLLSKR